MSCSMSFYSLPPLSTPHQCNRCLCLLSQQNQSHNPKLHKKISSFSQKATEYFTTSRKSNLGIQVATVLTTVAQPAFAVTGVNNEDDFISVLIQLGICAFLYFLVAPPIIMNWLRKRWYRRNVWEMYLQFNFVFMFFPGLLLWAPFVNFRRFPRDPDMKYPWETPVDPSKIKNAYLKYPGATPEDYDL